MLTSLLPGLRDLRSPLAAGSLLFASLYVLLVGRVEDATDRQLLHDGLQALVDALGRQGLLVVGAVASYLLGALYVSWMVAGIRRLARSCLPTITGDDYQVRKKSYWMRLVAPFSRPSLRRVRYIQGGHDPDAELAAKICHDIIFGGGKRLLVARRDLYDDYDRLRSESEFRDAVAGPATLFIVVALFNLDISVRSELAVACVWAVLALLLFHQARAMDREALSMHAHAVVDGVVSTPTTDTLGDLPVDPTNR